VVGNLINNAIKFTQHGQITVSTSIGEDQGVRIHVTDTGAGIPAEHRQRIFDEFVQLDPDSSHMDRNKGIGLGLFICSRLLDTMGGQITVESQPGRGSTFTVSLPPRLRVAPELNGHAPPIAAAALGAAGGLPPVEQALVDRLDMAGRELEELKGLRILLVEDHASTRRATSQLLSERGASVTEAADAASALRLLHESRPQVLLLDMMLPDADGTEVLSAIRRNPPASLQRILILTGDMAPERLEQVRQLGVDALLPKPIDLPMLLHHLRESGKGEGVGSRQ
jgi:CheY-like chemotaxis protein/anti-sigma regulatory factor (Ser/Thr protein kinase)